jgi:antitoxin component HigA of HigAB toxin-antitoxin module
MKAIELLTLLFEKWEEKNSTFDAVDPITLLHSLMSERGLKAKDLVEQPLSVENFPQLLQPIAPASSGNVICPCSTHGV